MKSRKKSRGENAASHWTDQDIQLLKKLIRQGVSRKDIAEQFGRSRQAINHACCRYGISSPRSPDWTKEEVEKLRKLLEEGVTKTEAAKILDRTYKAVEHACTVRGWFVREAYRPWSKTEEWILMDRLRRKSLDRIAQEFGRTKRSIQHKARELGRRWKDERWSFVRAAEVMGVSRKVVYRHWKKIRYNKKEHLTEQSLKRLAQVILDNPNSQVKSTKKLRQVVNGEWDPVEIYSHKRREWSIQEDRLLLRLCIENRVEMGRPDFKSVAKWFKPRSMDAVKSRYYKLVDPNKKRH